MNRYHFSFFLAIVCSAAGCTVSRSPAPPISRAADVLELSYSKALSGLQHISVLPVYSHGQLRTDLPSDMVVVECELVSEGIPILDTAARIAEPQIAEFRLLPGAEVPGHKEVRFVRVSYGFSLPGLEVGRKYAMLFRLDGQLFCVAAVPPSQEPG